MGPDLVWGTLSGWLVPVSKENYKVDALGNHKSHRTARKLGVFCLYNIDGPSLSQALERSLKIFEKGTPKYVSIPPPL